MHKSFRFALAVFVLLLMPAIMKSQAPDLGAASPFAMFTAAGAFSNDGNTVVTGDIGTNVGAFTGFPPGIVIGSIHVADIISAQAAIDVATAYSDLFGITCGLVLGTTLGGGQVLTPNVYCLGAASVLNGDLILDGQCDPDALFIFQIDGALSTAVNSTVTLTNGASLCNIYWQVNGAVSLGEGSVFKGTIVAGGAITLLEAASLDGRGLTTAGAIEMHNNVVNNEMQPEPSVLAADGPVVFCLGDSVVLSGNCGGTWSNGATTSSITVYAGGDYSVTTSNGCGNATSNHIIVTVNPLPDCTITGDFGICFGETTVICTPAGYASYAWSTGAIVNCITVSATGTYSVTVTDVNGCTSICSQDVTSIDLVPPQIVCPLNITIECNASTLPVNTGSATATDACDLSPVVVYVDVVEGSGCAQSFTITRTWTATDAAGNTASCSQTISGEDTTAPSITCPVVVSPIECGVALSFGMASASDACDASVTLTFTDVTLAGSCVQQYTVTRTWTAEDDCGNTATCSSSILVEDTSAPVISCPGDVTGVCDISTDPSVTGTATAVDNCDSAPVVTYADVVIDGNCPILLTRTWTATDDCGNTATCIQTIEVTDNTPPQIVCAAAPSPVECGSSFSFGLPTVTDACDAFVDITFSDVTIPGSCLQESMVTRTWTATDDCGNTATCSSTILLFDTTPPMITCPAVISPIECGASPSFGLATALDACDVLVDITFSDISTPGFCLQEYSVTRTWIATDDCGNSSSCSATIAVQDNTPPVISCSVVVSPVECGTPPFFVAPTAIDACDVLVEITFSDVSIAGLCPQEYSVTRTWIATDDCGNSSSCSSTILIQDNTAPLISCPSVVSPIPCGSIPDFGIATAIDACDAVASITFTEITNQGICVQEYSITRTWMATDDCGNTASCSSTIVVSGSTGLLITCPPAVTVQCAELVPAVDITLVLASGNCGTLTVTHMGDVIANQTCLNNFTLLRTYLATDLCDNTSSCSQLITVLDNTPPSITFINPDLGQIGDTLRVQCYGQDPEWDVPAFDANSVSAIDLCGGEVTVAFSNLLQDQGDCEVDGYSNLYRLTWTATDVCGNSSNAYVLMALVDTIPPVIHDVPDDITVNCEDLPWPSTVYATDECLCACIVLFQETERIAQHCQNGLVIIRSWTATDRCGNVTVETQRITLIDQEGPAIEIMQPELVGITNGTIFEYTCNEGGIPSFYDILDAESVFTAPSCGGTAIIAFAESSNTVSNCEFYGYVEQRTYRWTATDPCGNVTIMTIIARLIDNEAPVITGVPEMTCIGDPSLNFVDAIDNCEHPSVRFWDVTIINPCGPGTAVRRTYEAFDNCGNMARDTVILMPDSGILPVLTFVDPTMADLLPQSALTINCTASGQQYTTFSIDDVIVEGGCSIGTTVRFVETLLSGGDCATNGIVAVVELKWIATDMCGNRSEKILIANIVDETSPVFFQFSPVMFVGCHDSIPVMIATDNCGAVTMSMLDEIIPGPCASEYDIIRIYTATDPCGNTLVRQQIIHVGNGGGPAIVGVEEEICDDLTIPIVTAYDACAEQFVHVTMKQDTLDITCRDGLVIRRTWSATDACGNTSVIYQIIIINDTTPPEIYVPSYSVIYKYLDNDHNMVYHSQTGIMDGLNNLDGESVSVYDDCDQVIIPVLTIDTLFALNCDSAGYSQRRTYTWVATDICGNTSSISFTIDIIDDLQPEFRTIPADTIIICAPLPSAAEMFMMDSLEAVTVVYTEVITPGGGVGQWIVTRTWIATDSCHNEVTSIQHIYWQPETTLECSIILPDEIDCNSHGVVINSTVIGGVGPYDYTWRIVGEKCFLQAGQGTPEILIYMGWTDVTITLTVTDSFGCISVCTVVLHCTEQSSALVTIFDVDNADITLLNPATTFDQTVATDAVVTDLTLLHLWPNPATESINISFESGLEGILEYSFTNFLGQAVLREKMNVRRGYNARQIDASSLPNGSYLMQIKSDREMYTRIIVILRNG